ncbi:hypothetical protein [Absidia glauca]|uniref:Crossover junction endonuclease MUS81 n=1 Tax=Absidia glauca TaxID=4829 RepID=A0A163LQH2_ABSGL|nr:hypothetical protein [Absidia glauca]
MPPRAVRNCGNPLLRDWMAEWMEEARNMQLKSYYTYKKAHDSLASCPMVFQHPNEAQQLNGIGAVLAKKLEERMMDYCEENGLPMPTRRKGKRRTADDGLGGSDDSGGNKRRRGVPRPYVPRLRSGAYGILLTLLDFKDDGQNSATKSEIIREGQKYCEASLDLAEPGKNYTAWAGIKILKDKSYVWQNGSPPRFSLTDTGESMAQHLRHASLDNGNGIPSSSRAPPPRRPRNTFSRLSQMDDDFDDDNDDFDDGPPEIDLSLYVSNPEEFRRERAAEQQQRAEASASTASATVPSTTSTTAPTTAASTAPSAAATAAASKAPSAAAAAAAEAALNRLNANKTAKTTGKQPQRTPIFDDAIDPSRFGLDPDAYRQHRSSSTPASQQKNKTSSDHGTGSSQHQSSSWSNDLETITLLSPSPSPPSSPLIRPQTQNPGSSTSGLFQYTYLDTTDSHVRHMSQAAVNIDGKLTLTPFHPETTSLLRSFAFLNHIEVQGRLMYKIRFLSTQSGHTKARNFKNIDHSTCTAYILEQDADVVCPGLPAKPLLPLHTEKQQPDQQDFWPETASSQPSSSIPASRPSQSSLPNFDKPSPPRSERRPPDQRSPLTTETPTSSPSPPALDIPTMVSMAKRDGRLWRPNEYTIMMVLDNREVKMKTNREYIQDKLEEKGVPVVKRALDLGDVIWVAKHVETDEEMYLDVVVERKRMDDLVSSLKDGRFREQKYRLKESASRKVFYVVEEYNKEAALKFGAQAIQTALSCVQAIDRFYLTRTNNLDETIDYLVRLTRLIGQLYKDTTLQEIPTPLINRNNYYALKTALSERHASTYQVIPYAIYNQLNSKSGTTTLQDLYTKMLMTIKGVNAEKAYSLVKVYPTPVQLLKAMADASIDGNPQQLATQVTKHGITRRKWPASTSERLWEVWGKQSRSS